MSTVLDIYRAARAEGRQPVSFEIFPPKGDLTLEAAHAVAARLADLVPDFISVTCSAGGTGVKGATADVAQMIQDDFDVPTVAHLTCAEATEESLARAMDDFKRRGIENVLALRGDAMREDAPGPYRYARDLVECLAEEGFCVGAAAYPEGHIACDDMCANVEHLKQKQDAGASFFITQLFFDNDCFYRFWERALAAGITAPIACGVMPILGRAQIERMVFMCGASLPAAIVKMIARHEHAPDDLRRAGIERANEQLCDLAAHGVDGLHVYTMNKPDIAQANVSALRAAWRA
ncbi:methylenetetrahydrofolate reductase [Arabiibacter massiliensis]|uniref:methylenetetrahydrofolate reductase n=1 Tax=Arabiibacter massiliensis TaxID=1870985 RepID=UPI0009B9A2C6|nr:methylenetetrahydrofolate reductase [Arabiibacter massiliensis]